MESLQMLDEKRFEFVWKIENFLMCPFEHGECLKSPWFEQEVEGKLRATCRLKIYPRQIIPNGCEFLECKLDYVNLLAKLLSFEISILDFDGLVHSTFSNRRSNGNRPSDSSERDDQRLKLCKRRVLSENKSILLPQNSLNLKCRILIESDPSNFTDDIFELSKDLKRLHESKEYTDLKISIGDKEFSLHKSILLYRAPLFAEAIGLRKDTLKVSLKNISPCVVKSFIYYLYTGDVDTLSTKKQLDLFNFAERYDVPIRLDVSPSAKQISCTRVKTVRKVLDWSIVDYDRNPIKENQLLVNLEIAQFVITFTKSKDLQNKNDLLISIRRISEKNERIYLTCRISSLPDAKNDELAYTLRGEHWFHSENLMFKQWCQKSEKIFNSKEEAKKYFFEEAKLKKLEITLQENDLKKFVYLPANTLKLKLELEATKGEIIYESVCYTGNSTNSYSNLCNLASLKDDFFKCMVFRDFADLSLQVGPDQIHVHKYILSCRSPMFYTIFRKRLTEIKNVVQCIDKLSKASAESIDDIFDFHDPREDNDEILKIDLDRSTVFDLLEFVYTGQTQFSGAENILRLYDAAKMFQISTLEKQCAAFLTESETRRT